MRRKETITHGQGGMEREVELCREGERKLCNSEGQRKAVKVAKQGADRRDKR